MKKAGDYYAIVVEDTNVGQIVATATLIVEHKFIHACAKVQRTFYRPDHSHVGKLFVPTPMTRANRLIVYRQPKHYDFICVV